MDKYIHTIKFLILFFIPIGLFSQIEFEAGYYIDNSGVKHDCFIKNIDWLDNPSKFIHKNDLTQNEKYESINNIKEFGINGFSKYERHLVNIERSSDNISELTYNKLGIITDETLFLKVIIEGNATLYSYTDENGNFHRFFYSFQNNNIKPLIYHRYLRIDKSKATSKSQNSIITNNSYKQDLYNLLKCDKLKSKDFKKLKYNVKALREIFLKYNKCENNIFDDFQKKPKRDLLNFSVKLGLDLSALEIDQATSTRRDAIFNKKLNLKYSFELEYILQFNKNKWSVYTDPSFLHYTNTKVISSEFNSQTIYNEVDIEYNSIEIPLGIRYYMFLNKDLKLFVNTAYSFNYSINSKINFEHGAKLDIKPRNNFIFGIGIKYKNKLTSEIKLGSFRKILGDYIYWNSNYSYINVSIGYNLYHR